MLPDLNQWCLSVCLNVFLCFLLVVLSITFVKFALFYFYVTYVIVVVWPVMSLLFPLQFKFLPVVGVVLIEISTVFFLFSHSS